MNARMTSVDEFVDLGGMRLEEGSNELRVHHLRTLQYNVHVVSGAACGYRRRHIVASLAVFLVHTFVCGN